MTFIRMFLSLIQRLMDHLFASRSDWWLERASDGNCFRLSLFPRELPDKKLAMLY